MTTKICSRCNTLTPIEEFPLKYNKNHPTARKSHCKTCEYKRIREKHQKHKAEFKKRAIEYLGGKCSNPSCPISSLNLPIEILDFHHKGDKDSCISTLLSKNTTWTTIKKELDKCVLLCVLCHRLEHLKVGRV